MNILVGVADMKISNDPDSVLVTHSLGSCIGVAVYDQAVHAGGLLHFMLPDSSINPVKAQQNPCMFADSGIPLLFKTLYQLGGKKQRMRVIVVGGAHVNDQEAFFNIGKRNYLAVRKIFWKNNVIIDYQHVGGNGSRTLKLAIKDGRTRLKVSGESELEI